MIGEVGKNIQKRILIYSQKLRIYHFIEKHYSPAFEIERCDIHDDFGEQFVKRILEKTELVIIDAEGDFVNAVEYIREIRLGSFAGGLLLISRSEDTQQKIAEKISAIDAGADEYLGYPQTNEEIAASVKALLRRYGRKEELEYQIGGKNFAVSPQARKVVIDQTELAFTKTEFAIFQYLLLHLNRSVSHKELYEAVWKKEYMHDDRNIMAHVHRMRKKMGDDIKNPKYIQNVYGIGYMIEGI